MMKFRDWLKNETMTSTSCVAGFSRITLPMVTRKWPTEVTIEEPNKKKKRKKLQEAVNTIAGSNLSGRKQRLYAVGCCRQIWDLITDENYRSIVNTAEMYADGQATESDVRNLRQVNDTEWPYYPAHLAAWNTGAFDGRRAAIFAAHNVIKAEPDIAPQLEKLKHCIYSQYDKELPKNQDILHLARSIYEGRDWSSMYALADALEEADVIDQDVLHHCRNDKIHARGCWVVDNILRKS